MSVLEESVEFSIIPGIYVDFWRRAGSGDGSPEIHRNQGGKFAINKGKLSA
jgi:hypothetical protein